MFSRRVLGYAVLAVAVIVIGDASFISLRSKPAGPVALNASTVTITNVGANAFGKLGASDINSATPAAKSNATANSEAPVAMMAAPQIRVSYVTAVKYDYVGEPISQDQARLNVLKKIASSFSADQATAALIDAANQFLASHGIAATAYGAPQVSRQSSSIVPLAATAASAVASMPMIRITRFRAGAVSVRCERAERL